MSSSDFELPAGWSKLYEEAMNRIKNQSREDVSLAHDTLALIVNVYKPLTLPAIQHALGTLDGDTEFHHDGVPEADSNIAVCAGLVTLDKHSSDSPSRFELRLAHPTIIDFFHKNPQPQISPPHRDELLPRICLTYLGIALDRVTVPENDRNYKAWVDTTLTLLEENYPFIRYACEYWPAHARKITSGSYWNSTSQFLCDHPLKVWLCILIGGHVRFIPDSESAKLPPTNISPMHAAVLFDFPEVVFSLLTANRTLCLDSNTDANGNTPTSWAAYNNRCDILNTLLSFNTQDTQYGHVGLKGRGEVFYSAEQGNEQVLETLFSRSRSYNVNYNANLKDKGGETPAIAAARNGHLRCIEILERDFHVNLADGTGATALVHAIRGGHEDIIGYLLGCSSGASLGATALSEATFGHREGEITLLLQHLLSRNHSAIVQKVVQDGIITTAKSGDLRTLKRLLQIRQQIDTIASTILWNPLNFTDDAGRTALSHAAEQGHEDVTNELLEEYAVADVRDNEHWSPLHYAVFNGHIQIVQLLLTKITYLRFSGPPDSEEDLSYDISDGDDSDDGKKVNRVIGGISTLVVAPTFIRAGISRVPSGIVPCAKLLLESLGSSNSLNLMLERVFRYAVLQTIIHHPVHKNLLTVRYTGRRGLYRSKVKRSPRIKSVHKKDSTLRITLLSNYGMQLECVLNCGPTDTGDS